MTKNGSGPRTGKHASLTSAKPRKRRGCLWRLTKRSAQLVALVLVIAACVGAFNCLKPLPEGLAFGSPAVPVVGRDVTLLQDLTYRTEDGETVHEHEIFDTVLDMIDRARWMIVLDMFLLNPHRGMAGEVHRPLSEELTEALLAKREDFPQLPVVLITDPINDVYGGDPSPQLTALASAGVHVVITDLDRLRDSNPLYSSFWRVGARWFGNRPVEGRFPHPFIHDGPRVGARTWLYLLNFKANHRKMLLADNGRGRWSTLVTSANPHDASSGHSNIALRIDGPFAHGAFRAEMAVVEMSGGRPPFTSLPRLEEPRVSGTMTASYLTESRIRDHLLETLGSVESADRVDIAMFYLSHRDVIDALVELARQGSKIRVVLDPNRDAFGREKSGSPNRQTASELIQRSDGYIEVRWYATAGEQFHTKMVVARGRERVKLFLGSANLTRRNLDDLNLEADVEINMIHGDPLDESLRKSFERIWSNQGGVYTTDYETFRDDSRNRYWWARTQELTGLCTF
jgi:hypothetical protein